MIAYVFLILFLIAAVLNLISTKKDRKRLFAFTKPALLSLLCLYCAASGLPTPDLLLIAALFACFLGDVLLMLKGDLWFAAGGISFLFGHVLLILIFLRYADASDLPLAFMITAAVIYAAAAGCVMARARKEAPPLLKIPMLLYLLFNGAMNVFALTRLLTAPGLWSAVSYAGAILFFLSDCVLFLTRFDTAHPRFYKTNFYVMLTYISGVFLITLGLVH